MALTPLEIHQAQLLANAGSAGARFEPPPQPTPKPAPGTFVVAPGDNASAMPRYSPWYATDLNPNPNPTQAELDAYYASPLNGKIPFVPGVTSYPSTPVEPPTPNAPAPPPLPPSPGASSGPLVGSFKEVNAAGQRVYNNGSRSDIAEGQKTTQDGLNFTAAVVIGPDAIPEITWIED